jgi:uncharacterized protein YjiS (DUF1127 family)
MSRANTSFIGRIGRSIANALRREKARHQTTIELSRMDSRTLADLGLSIRNIPGDVARLRRAARHDDSAALGDLIREFDGPAAPLHPILNDRGYGAVPSAFVADDLSPRRLRKAAANRNAPVASREAASA